MPKIQRTTQKVFAQQAESDELAVFGTMKTGTPVYSNDVATLQGNDAFTQGWQDAILEDKAPYLEETNGMFYGVTSQLAYQFQEGIPEYDTGTEYYIGSIVKVLNTENKPILYVSLTDNNIGNPVTDTTNWEELKLGGGGGLELCDIGMALYVDESKGLRRYLNGQVLVINATTQPFLDRLKQIQAVQPSLFTTEENWQAAKTLSPNGFVDKFVIAEDESTVRLPNYPDYITTLSGIGATTTISAYNAPVVGNGITIGLTNGETNVGMVGDNGGYGILTNTTAYGVVAGTKITASQFNSKGTTYGLTTDSANSGIIAKIPAKTVTSAIDEEQITLKYFIQIATGAETENNIINDIELNNPYSLFDYKYTDSALYNVSWLLSNGQDNPKSTYVTAYEALEVEANAEITAGTTVQLPSGVEYTKRGLSVKLSTDSSATEYDFKINTANETFVLPTKTNLEPISGTIPVIGSGMTLGITNGTVYGGLASPSSGFSYFSGAYGTDIGTSGVSSGALANNQTYGVTTDPTKSGLVADLSQAERNAGVKLYFYVGETVQNASLIDAGRISEEVADLVANVVPRLSGEIDYSVYSAIFSQSALGEYTVDLSSVLPNDGMPYLLSIRGYIALPDSTGVNRYLRIYNDSARTERIYDWTGDGGAMGTGDFSDHAVLLLKNPEHKLYITLASSDDTSAFSRAAIALYDILRLGRGY